MTLAATKKLSKHICRLLKVLEVQYPIGRTNKGNLTLRFSAISDDYEIMLDSVPLPTKDFLNDENNINLKKMIEKYWFEREEKEEIGLSDTTQRPVQVIPPKPRGRPKKVVE